MKKILFMFSIIGNPGKPPKDDPPTEGLRAVVRKKSVNTFIMWMPFIMLVITMISVVCSQYDWYNTTDINKVFMFVGNITGYSIATNLFFLWVAYVLRFCTFSKIAIWTLLLSNFLNIVYIATNFSQTMSIMIDMIELGLGFILALLYIAKPNKNDNIV